MTQNNNGLLIAALVAIVAVVGLVILFKGGSTGAVAGCDSHEKLVMKDMVDGSTTWSCLPVWSLNRDDPDHLALEQGMASEYGVDWTAYESRVRRLNALQVWEPNMGDTYQRHEPTYVDGWAPNKGETYSPDPEVFVGE